MNPLCRSIWKCINLDHANIHITKSKAVAENAALNDGVDDDDSVARENDDDDDFANAPTDSPFDNDELDDSELFDMDED